MTEIWKELGEVGFASAKKRTVRAAVGTAYWVENKNKQYLYVKVREDRWLCFAARTISACLTQFAAKPGAGAASNDHNIANGITESPSTKAVRQTQLSQRAAVPAPSTAKTPTDIWRALEAKGADLIWRSVAQREFAAAEAALDFRFPPSYRELLRTGAPALRGMAFAVLTPKQVVLHTKRMRTLEPDWFEDSASLKRVEQQLSKAVFFQFQRYSGDGYVFLTDTVNAKGEMRIANFAHDYIEELDWKATSKVVVRDLLACTRQVAEQIEADLPP